ncbi:unnamed protein product [Allacma fusca]|uniref:Uncharacterized protein n=1 Tax=Allacma fusca TaxID=39272 RepID=A0A8J2LIS8_9HEXA|nr:unnamed protein product [Allacma fusca]
MHQGQIFQDVVLAPFETNPVTPQYFIVDADGSIVPIMDGNNFTILAPEPDDEIPPHKLDHMYAKKPREPGSEVVKPARRRSKKKELLKNHYYVQEMMEEAPPKINIIRGRHAMTTPHNRPKILTSPQKMLSTFASTNMFSGSANTGVGYIPPVARNITKKKVEEIPQAVVFEDYEDFNAPSPGAVVTVCDGVELDPVIVNARTLKPKKLSYHISCGESPSSIENRNSSLDSMGEPEDDTELFLDFPMEEEEEVDPSIDVDFNEISMNPGSGIDILRSAPITYFHPRNEVEDVEYDDQSPDASPRGSESDKRRSPTHRSQNLLDDNYYQSTNKVAKKRGRPMKAQPDSLYGEVDDWGGLHSSGSSHSVIIKHDEVIDVEQIEVVAPVPTRRSTRPIKAPSRLDDIEDISSTKRKRR